MTHAKKFYGYLGTSDPSIGLIEFINFSQTSYTSPSTCGWILFCSTLRSNKLYKILQLMLLIYLISCFIKLYIFYDFLNINHDIIICWYITLYFSHNFYIIWLLEIKLVMQNFN